MELQFSEDFGTTIEVNKTSSFTISTSSSMNLAPGQNTITFTIDNNGNFEDTFTVSSSSLNGWFVHVQQLQLHMILHRIVTSMSMCRMWQQEFKTHGL